MSSMFGETDDDVSLRTRRAEDRRTSELNDASIDREVTLNTGTVLALFFTLALICAVFFGFGYSMGRKSTQTAVADANSTPAAAAIDTSSSSSYKPAPGSPAVQPVPGYMAQAGADASNGKTAAPSAKAVPATSSAAVETTPPGTRKAATAPMADPVTTTPVARTPPATVAPAAVPAVTYAPPAVSGTTYVQIAAVSHQEDADVLMSALQRRGYKVLARTDTGDRLIHVQIGPFTDRKQAEVIRQKLLGDGYNAFLK
jgi:cell division septation protein DedD